MEKVHLYVEVCPVDTVLFPFSIATIIALITEEPLCIMLSYLLAFIVAQSRVDSETHSILEVAVGALFRNIINFVYIQDIYLVLLYVAKISFSVII